MFILLMEATTAAENGREAGNRHAVMAVIDCDESDCVQRATDGLERRGWSAIECKRLGRLSEDADMTGQRDSYLAGAIAHAEMNGIAFVVYETPIKPS